MGSMHTGLEDEKDYTRLAAYFARRAKGGVGLMVTGGFSPNILGWLVPFSSKLSTQKEVQKHQVLTEAVHQEGSKIALQILHAGRYSYHPFAVAPSAVKSAISPFTPWALPRFGVNSTISAYANCARLAKEAGYDGIEIMGSEGYLINQFITQRTNKRRDDWGGDYQSRIRFPLNIVKRVREEVGPQFIIIFRLSMLDLVEHGSTWDEIVILAKALEQAGVTLINTGIGWHEARIPTIATMVPRAAFTFVTKRLKAEVSVPLVCTNRINTPEVAEQLLEDKHADMVSMARPLLADPDFVLKAQANQSNRINTCIACNQACLDHVFKKKTASCLVNPRACHETLLFPKPITKRKKIAIVGAGPAGLACAVAASARGHQVTLFDKEPQIGGQFNLAKTIPGKDEFYETLRYFDTELTTYNVEVKLNTTVTEAQLDPKVFSDIVIATGVYPRTPKIPGVDHPSVKSYLEVLKNPECIGSKVAIIGAGGIGFDIAALLLHGQDKTSTNAKAFYHYWGIDTTVQVPGGLLKTKTKTAPKRHITLLQRRKGKLGKTLGKTTGWIHRQMLKRSQVTQLDGVTYTHIDDQGLHLKRQDKKYVLKVDHIIICAGQHPQNSLSRQLSARQICHHLIGGAYEVNELDAKFAIQQGMSLGDRL